MAEFSDTPPEGEYAPLMQRPPPDFRWGCTIFLPVLCLTSIAIVFFLFIFIYACNSPLCDYEIVGHMLSTPPAYLAALHNLSLVSQFGGVDVPLNHSHRLWLFGDTTSNFDGSSFVVPNTGALAQPEGANPSLLLSYSPLVTPIQEDNATYYVPNEVVPYYYDLVGVGDDDVPDKLIPTGGIQLPPSQGDHAVVYWAQIASDGGLVAIGCGVLSFLGGAPIWQETAAWHMPDIPGPFSATVSFNGLAYHYILGQSFHNHDYTQIFLAREPLSGLTTNHSLENRLTYFTGGQTQWVAGFHNAVPVETQAGIQCLAVAFSEDLEQFLFLFPALELVFKTSDFPWGPLSHELPITNQFHIGSASQVMHLGWVPSLFVGHSSLRFVYSLTDEHFPRFGELAVTRM